MQIKPDLKLRQVGDRWMLVDVSASNANITDVYTFNATAAAVWERVAAGDDAPAIVEALCADYDVDPSTAAADVAALLASWRHSGLVTE